jgi:phosphoglycolate phosphatase
MRYDLVIFDFDGTLADSFPWFVRTVNTAADRYRFRRLEERDLETLRSRGAREVIAHLGIPAWKLPFIGRHMRRMKDDDREEIQLFPGIGPVLERLSRAGVRLAIVSSNSLPNVRHILGPENAARIDVYECGSSLFGKAKRFRRVLARSGIPAAAALCVGDELRDLQSAREAGIAFGAVGWGYTTEAALRAGGPAEFFETVEQLANLAEASRAG